MRSAAEGGADLLMMCKDEQEVPSPDRKEAAEGGNHVRKGVTGRSSAPSAAPEVEKPVRILSLPRQPVGSGRALGYTPKSTVTPHIHITFASCGDFSDSDSVF